MITLRSSFLLVALLVAVLEILLCSLSLLGYFRPFTAFDVEFLCLVTLVATANEKLSLRYLNFGKGLEHLPAHYFFYFTVAVYVLIFKATYFLAFSARLLRDHW